MPSLQENYPWIKQPLIVSGPLRPYATANLAAAVSLAGGIGLVSFVPGRTDKDLEALESLLAPIRSDSALLPAGVGYLLHSAPFETARAQINRYRPAIVWLFAPVPEGSGGNNTLSAWTWMVREASPASRIWVQVGSVAGALEALEIVGGDVTLVAQGVDAGGHGLASGAGVVSLVPEMRDALAERGYSRIPVLAAGGIVDGRGGAAAFALGADGIVLGTRVLGSEEVTAPDGFREAVLAATDGGQSTVRTILFDRLRGTKLGGVDGWPDDYDGRGLRNLSSNEESEGMGFDEVKKRFDIALKDNKPERFGAQGRDVTYAGTGVGLIKKIMPAKDIVDEVRRDIVQNLRKANQRMSITAKL